MDWLSSYYRFTTGNSYVQLNVYLAVYNVCELSFQKLASYAIIVGIYKKLKKKNDDEKFKKPFTCFIACKFSFLF